MLKNKLFSILLGFIFGNLIMKFSLLKIMQNLRQHGPDSNLIKNITFYDQINKYCYRFLQQFYVCPSYLLKKG